MVGRKRPQEYNSCRLCRCKMAKLAYLQHKQYQLSWKGHLYFCSQTQFAGWRGLQNTNSLTLLKLGQDEKNNNNTQKPTGSDFICTLEQASSEKLASLESNSPRDVPFQLFLSPLCWRYNFIRFGSSARISLWNFSSSSSVAFQACFIKGLSLQILGKLLKVKFKIPYWSLIGWNLFNKVLIG